MRILLMLLFFGFDAAIAQQTDTLNIRNKDSLLNVPVDTTVPVSPKFETLIKDDPQYNKRYPIWIPAVRILMADAANWVAARYIYKFDWAYVSPTTWKNSSNNGWEWDTDRFGINFIGHPHTGNYYYNIARSNGYNFWQSIPFTAGGSIV